MSGASDGWIRTFTGRQFWPLGPHERDVRIKDIAHALAMKCRYGGHCRMFYCPTPDQRILTADLRWVPAGDLKVGDELFGFDEKNTELGSAGNKRRRFRHAVVTHAQPAKRRVVRLEMEDGSTVKSSLEHPWLVATKVSRNQTWATSGAISKALGEGRRRYMHKFFDTWETSYSRGGGWLAGLFDGEGHISFSNRGGTSLAVSQNPGLVLDEARRLVRDFGFNAGESYTGNGKVLALQIKGGWRENARLLGIIRPVRLLDKILNGLRAGDFCKQLDGKGPALEIIKAYDEGEQWVAGIETSTHTYLCEGFGAHNSVAQHSVLVSQHVDPSNALWGLLHDAEEAYLADIPKPVKRQLADIWTPISAAVQAAICERYGLPIEEPAEVKRVDNAILWDEISALMSHGLTCMPDDAAALGVIITPWPWEMAEYLFLKRFEELR